MGVKEWFGRRGAEAERDTYPLTVDAWAQMMSYNGLGYGLSGIQQTLKGDTERVTDGFAGLAETAYKANGVVFACMLVRQLLFSEARFQFRALRSGRPGDLFGSPALSILEHPWPNATTGDLLTRALQDVDLGGNFFCVRRQDRLRRLRPDWVTLVLGSEDDPHVEAGDVDAEVIGLLYFPGGRNSGRDPVPFLREEFAHFAPTPDPTASYRGMSWLTPIIREIQADSAMTVHKSKFLEQGATPNMVVSLDPSIAADAFERWRTLFEDKHAGAVNAYRTLYLGGGASVEVVGANLQQLDFKVTQGAGETRVAAAAGVPPVIVGLSEGLQAATYSNYSQARRRFADGTMRPLWRNFAGSLSTIVPVPGGAELWYDDRDISFLKEDLKDAADIQQVEAASVKTLIDAGFEPASVVAAITAGDMNRLVHTGLYSVQLQPPMPDGPVQTPEAAAGRALAALVAAQLANGSTPTPGLPAARS